jgi:Fe-S cluster assembly protein SufD
MAFEERIDVHSELYDVRTAAIKTLKIKFPTKDEAWKYAKCTLKMTLLFSKA